jgi:hypothetical protein
MCGANKRDQGGTMLANYIWTLVIIQILVVPLQKINEGIDEFSEILRDY